ncbi:MAG: 2Fe-2S iron-sulfur cluster-binding protein [Acidimicrobiaceae bacterium]|nr:2Fe-2S iron-sulfur cluster-binding protein [Acidimicrobiaceae bacterium]
MQASTLRFDVDGRAVEVPEDGDTLLGVLRDRVGIEAVLDGCSPQGQCGCCTVLVDDEPRVACVTPARRVAGRRITTAAGLSPDEQQRWSEAFLACGATQCGFCTPGIVCRFVGHERRGADLSDRTTVDRALAAHLCRCTGWQTIREAAAHTAAALTARASDPPERHRATAAPATVSSAEVPERDPEAAARRASIETGGPQQSVPASVLGDIDFGADGAPNGTLTAVAGPAGEWHAAETLAQARQQAGKVQGRRTTLEPAPPIDIPEPPPGTQWDVRLATCWTEPGYLETDAAWCVPDGEPSDPLANGGAFGGKAESPVRDEARHLAEELGQPVRVLWSREDAVRRGPKRPPLAAGLHADGTGIIRIARTPGAAEVLQAVLPNADIVEVDLPGPPTSTALRAAPWAEAQMLAAALNRRQAADPLVESTATVDVTSPDGAAARATVSPDGIKVHIDAGDPLDEVTLRSYVIGASHMAWSWVTSESLSVDAEGEIQDLTIRSFGIARSAETPHIEVEIEPSQHPPVQAGEAVFAAVAAATWLSQGTPPQLPTGGSRSSR